ncbi:CRM-domain containing factor CFM3, chloroplastic/mitochondrial-like [Durio zibethinus]|uniref:CRM-domain containing factor CFM3, chloroplastic/mitochondrial-like n=1 Tax=Durio zibethinus TaxID=66656 RepID=A0A6P6AMA6_DURZI|nr:CRM-domain containing factor CFM3, chloroplastic/mitochondrial-like [Durio zibethinus]
MAAIKLTEIPLRTSLPFSSYSYSYSPSLNLFFSAPKPSFRFFRPFSSLRSGNNPSSTSKPYCYPRDHQSSGASSSFQAWPSPSGKVIQSDANDKVDVETRYFDKDKGQSAIERIVLRLRNLGLGSDDEEEDDDETDDYNQTPVTGEERLGDLLKREWVRPDTMVIEREKKEAVLPWEREEAEVEVVEERGLGFKKRRVKAPTLAELTIEDEELRRLRRMGMYLRERINVPKAGITQAVLEKIHDKWRKEELVRLKFHEFLAVDMKTAHEIVERRTGGLVLWRSGSVMVVYRGSNYEGPSRSPSIGGEGETLFVPDVSSASNAVRGSESGTTSTPEKCDPIVVKPERSESMTEEEAEYNSLLDGLGPRFVEWWGTGVLPVDADLLPQKIPGYKTPFRLLPAGMRARLTNAEMTNLRKIAKSLPCHFALGRNRNHQGLAAAIIKLWEKSLVAKIAVKRGIQNTNNKLMSEELKNLTGGILLLRNKYFIVIYRGKDFLPTSVAAALQERQELTKQIQDVEEKVRIRAVEPAQSGEEDKGQTPAGTLAEFYEAQARWGRDISAEEREKMIEEASKAKHARLVKHVKHKLAVAQAKKLRAEKLLAKVEASMIPASPDYDQETITDEERAMYRRVGLRMKPYLPLGIRGVFDGVIENMHLHWKHRELVKLITKQKTLEYVEDTARLLEYESGGILVAIERLPKGYVLIYYRGKNYRRPISLRPRNLLTKAKALKRSVAMQRHEALSEHISELEKTIEQMKGEMGASQDVEDDNNGESGEHGQFDPVSELTQFEASVNSLSSTRLQSEDEASCMASDGDEEYDDELDDYEDDGEFDDDEHEDDNIDSEADEDSLQSNFEKANFHRYH